MSDTGDQVVGVNLTASQDSNRYFGAFDVEATPSSDASSAVSMTDEDGWFSYRFIGTLKGDVQVLELSQSTGGSGLFKTLLFLTRQYDQSLAVDWDEKSIKAGAPRSILFKKGEIVLGDRWRGSVRVENGRLYIDDLSAIAEGRAQDVAGGWYTYDP
ncbi:MAG: hypothetical protein ACFB2Z_11420 [Maricaulaceae bacterium]